MKRFLNFDRFLVGAREGRAGDQFCVGCCYLYGLGVERDPREAVKWFMASAQQRDVDGICFLAYCYAEGVGIVENQDEAASLLQWAMDIERADNRKNRRNCDVISKDPDKAFFGYYRGALGGHVAAQLQLVICYMYGKGVECDMKQADFWFKKATKQGDAEAQYNLGTCYMEGSEVEKNTEEGLSRSKESAEQGVTKTQYDLGVCYKDGVGVEANDGMAVDWFIKAAHQQDSRAQLALGCYYIVKAFNPHFFQQGISWLEKADVHNEPLAALFPKQITPNKSSGAQTLASPEVEVKSSNVKIPEPCSLLFQVIPDHPENGHPPRVDME